MSGRCGGLHCDGCGKGPGGLVALVLVLVLAAAAGPVIQAVTDLLELALVVAAGLLVTGAAVGVLMWRHRRRVQLWRPGPAPLRIIQSRAEPVSGRARPAIEAPRPGTGTQARRHTPARVVTRPGAGQQCNRRTGRRS